MASKRLAYIDFIKVIAVFMVITLHNGTWNTDFIANGSFASAIQYCVRLFCEGVPIFMLVNGFLMFDKKFDAKKHAFRTLNVFLIIIIWSIIMEVYFTFLEARPFNVLDIITSVLRVSISTRNTGILWFLQALVVVYMLFPVLKYLYDTKMKLFNYLLLVLIISTYGTSFVSLLSSIFESDLLNAFNIFTKQYSLVLSNNIYVLYFMLGGYLYKNFDALNKKMYILIGCLCALVACVIGIAASLYKNATFTINFNYSQVFLMFTLIGAFFVCSRIPFRFSFINKLLASIGDNTMGIYLLHRIVNVTLMKYIHFPTNLIMRLAISLIVLLICWGITVLIRKIPKVSYIVKL